MECHCIIFQRDVRQNGFGQHFGLGNIFSFEKMLPPGFLQHCVRQHWTLSPAEGRSRGEAATALPGVGKHRAACFFPLYIQHQVQPMRTCSELNFTLNEMPRPFCSLKKRS